MSDRSGLFDDVEQANDNSLAGGDEIQPDGALPFDLQGILSQWASGLTYDEVHSFTVGFAPIFVGLLFLGLPGIPMWIPNGLLFLGLVLGGVAVLGISTRSEKLSKYARLEPHYLIGAQAIAAAVGSLCMAVIRSAVWLGGLV
jgi:hypothetical protein